MILGISGKIGTGKTTLAQHIQHILAHKHLFSMGVPVLRAFGDAIKVEAARLYSFPLQWAYTQEGKQKLHGGKAVRQILQEHGMARRAEDKLYWVNRFKESIALDMAQGNCIIVHDMRMPTEADAVKSLGGETLRLEPYVGWVQDPKHGNDITETALDAYQGWDYTFRPAFGKLPYTAARIVDNCL